VLALLVPKEHRVEHSNANLQCGGARKKSFVPPTCAKITGAPDLNPIEMPFSKLSATNQR